VGQTRPLTVEEFADWVLSRPDTSMPPGMEQYDFNNDGGINVLDLQWYGNMHYEGRAEDIWADQGGFHSSMFDDDPLGGVDRTKVSGVQNMQASQVDLGISSGAVGSRKELGRMLESYKGRTSLIQAAQRQKAVYTIDRFDGGLNQNKSPRDLSYWEACQMDCLSPSKVGRLIPPLF